MGEHSGIEWTDHTFNPWWGCVKVSPGCAHCYADALSSRYGHDCWGSSDRRLMSGAHWRSPFKWDRRAREADRVDRVFCGSMCDVLERAPHLESERNRLWAVIRHTPNLQWLLLTKRPENAIDIPEDVMRQVWFGVSVENQEWADKRLPLLVKTVAPVRFISYEPALGPVELEPHFWKYYGRELGGPTQAIHWVIAGGESGHGHRPCDEQWIRSVRDQCSKSKVAFFFKQWGGNTAKANGKILDGIEHCEFPTDHQQRSSS